MLEADINMYDVDHFALLGVDIIRDSDAFHCEQCSDILIRDVELSGGTGAHETVKINQSQYIYIENSDIHGAEDNAIDFVAVQYGHVTNNRIHGADDWCMYAKGGSAYLTMSGNEVFDCGQPAGQRRPGTGSSSGRHRGELRGIRHRDPQQRHPRHRRRRARCQRRVQLVAASTRSTTRDNGSPSSEFVHVDEAATATRTCAPPTMTPAAGARRLAKRR